MEAKHEENNESIKITDTETVEKITNHINSLSLKKGKIVQIPPGWIYQLVWYDANDKIFGVIGIVDESTLGHTKVINPSTKIKTCCNM